MKKGTLNFLGRKNQSLYDTNVKMKDMENVELVLGSSAIPESGTASVRARPTVKHHAPTSDSFQGFAVPTPTVPFLAPAVNGTKINGSVADDQSSNGSTLSVNDPNEEEIFVPPPPSMAPPPPPDTFILPPPEFVGDLNSLRLQPPPVPPPKPPSSFISLQEQDLTFLNPPPISPTKPPPTGTSASASWMPVASPVPAKVPDRPKYAPPQPPTERPQNTFKIPPPKPIRISSVASFDSPPNTPAPPHPSQTPTLSTFNPQSNPQLYSAQKTSVRHEDQDTKPKHMLLLEDAGTGLDFPKDGKSTTKPVFKDVQDVKQSVDGPVVPKHGEGTTKPVFKDVQNVKQSVAGPFVPKHEGSTTKPVFKDVQDVKESVAGSVVSKDGESPTKPVSKDALDIKESVTVPPLSPLPSQKPKLMTAAALKEIGRSPKTSPQATPQYQRVNGTQDSTVDKLGKPEGSSTVAGKFSPLIDRKLRNLKGNETSGASPLALLMAAKEREKHRSNPTQENSTKKNDQPSDLSLSSLVATSKPISSSSLNSLENLEEGPTKSSVATSKQLQVNSQVPSPSPTPSRTVQAASPNTTNLESDLAQYEDNKPELNMPLLPPPPEFDDLDDIEPPPAMRPPDPPKKKALPQSMTPSITQSMTPSMKSSMTPSMTPSITQSMTPTMKSSMTQSMTPSITQSMTPSMTPSMKSSMTPSMAQSMTQSMTPSVTAVLPSPPKATPPPVPGPPPLDTITKSKPPPVQAKPKVAPSPQPTTLSQNQATLLSILKKKMLEMDQKIAPVGEPESSSDDWGSPVSEDDNKVPVVPKVTPQKNSVANKTATLDMKELESKMARKYQETAATKLPTSNGPKPKHQYGMTFTVRPGTKQPITLVSKGES